MASNQEKRAYQGKNEANFTKSRNKEHKNGLKRRRRRRRT